VAAVERAIIAAGHVPVDMTDFPAADQAPAALCTERVRGCNVYVGLLGMRYGSPVRDKAEVSYTELEFDTATESGLDRLVFLLDENAADVGIPSAALIDREFGARQDAFRRRVQDSKLVTPSFANPDALRLLVERSLRDLADTRARIGSGIKREQVPAEPQPVRASKFVNPPPATAPAWFQDRQVETGLLARYVTDPGIRIVTVTGRGGIGKTAMVCRLLKGLEAGRVPDVEGESAAITVGGIVYLSRNGLHQVEYPTLVADLLRLLPPEEALRLQRVYQDPQHSPARLMLAVLEAFPAGDPVVVLLDNLESVMDAEREALAEQPLAEALAAVLTAPEHAVTVIATTRVTPSALLKVEPSRQRQLWLDKGLGSPDAQLVLRALDDDGRLGLRDAPDELLDGLRRHTRGFPRALEAVKAILDGDRTLTPRDVLDRTRGLSEDQVVQVLVGEAYQLLDAPARQVMQALAVFPAPVSAVGVDFLLRPVNPTTDAAPILTRLVRRQLARFQDRHYYLHPVDRDYARSQLPPGGPGDSPAAFTLAGLQAGAADYYAQIRTLRESWRSLEDVRPQLAEFELRCEAGDYDTAASVLADIDFDYLQVWGHYRTLVELHGRIHGRITDPALNAAHLLNAGNCRFSLGEYRQAIDLHTQALAIFLEISDRRGEGVELGNLGNCHYSLGEYRQAIDLHTQALAIARDIGHRRSESSQLGNLGTCHSSLGEYRRAIDLHTQALAIAREISERYGEACALGYLGRAWLASGDADQAATLLEQAVTIADATGDIEPAAEARSWLAQARLQLGDPAAALAAATRGREFPYPPEEPTLRLLEGLALLELHRPEDSMRAFSAAVAAAGALLALADTNVAALQARALALSGLVVATSDPARATEASGAIARAITSAAGKVRGHALPRSRDGNAAGGDARPGRRRDRLPRPEPADHHLPPGPHGRDRPVLRPGQERQGARRAAAGRPRRDAVGASPLLSPGSGDAAMGGAGRGVGDVQPGVHRRAGEGGQPEHLQPRRVEARARSSRGDTAEEAGKPELASCTRRRHARAAPHGRVGVAVARRGHHRGRRVAGGHGGDGLHVLRAPDAGCGRARPCRHDRLLR
jgi:tetratricopeptide (TPR) repeat protein